MKFKCMLVAFCFLFIMGCKEKPTATAQQEGTQTETAQKETSLAAISENNQSQSTFVDLEGKPVELADYKGKRVLLNFWATWCRPCIEEMPSLLEAQEKLEGDNYVFLIASDQSVSKIQAFKEKKGFNFKFLKFNGAMSDFEISALPATFIYNIEGTLIQRIDGATAWDTPEIINQLKAIQ